MVDLNYLNILFAFHLSILFILYYIIKVSKKKETTERKETNKKAKETAYSFVYRSSQWKFPSFRLYWFKLQLIRNNKSVAFSNINTDICHEAKKRC